MYSCYVLESITSGRLYIGLTNDVSDRLRRHNEGINLSTRNRWPWIMIFQKDFNTRTEAVALEKKLKAFKNPAKVIFS